MPLIFHKKLFIKPLEFFSSRKIMIRGLKSKYENWIVSLQVLEKKRKLSLQRLPNLKTLMKSKTREI